MSMLDTAKAFFDACETGQGWEGCRAYCHEDASFSCQAELLAETKDVAGYVEWVKGLFVPIPDMHPEVKAFSADAERRTVTAVAVVHGTQSGPGGPVPPTGKAVAADYVYVMRFEGDRIRHVTKVWNDGYTMKLLGWAGGA